MEYTKKFSWDALEGRRNLRSEKSGLMIDYGKKNTFQQQANQVFNTLPANIRVWK